MRLPLIRGIIERRILANYRVDPARLRALLPEPFRPKLANGYGVAGICLIRLGAIRPRGLPAALGVSSENAAHRIAVEWDDTASGQRREGVFIPRRDTSPRLNAIAGGRVFAGVHHHATFDVRETEDELHVALRSDDGRTRVSIDAKLAGTWPSSSVLFNSTSEASAFFEAGSLGYSPSARPGELDALELRSHAWKVEPLEVTRIESSFFDDASRFPQGSAVFDCALLMRGIPHEWHEREGMTCACGSDARNEQLRASFHRGAE
jgi:hypothetical protein